MVFPDYYFFAERCLVNHTIEKKLVNNLDDCELMCYLNDDCVSLNFKKDPEDEEPLHICEMPIFIIVGRRWVRNRFFEIIAFE